jgi:hypothetical protein
VYDLELPNDVLKQTVGKCLVRQGIRGGGCEPSGEEEKQAEDEMLEFHG